MTTPADDIAVAQLRSRLDTLGEMIAVAVRDAYARGLVDGMERARAMVEGECERPPYQLDGTMLCGDDPAERRPTVV